jgi:hypothetical protein
MQTRKVLVKVPTQHGGNNCPEAQSRACQTQVCPTPAPTPAPTPVPTPSPTAIISTPIIHIRSGDVLTVDAEHRGEYKDEGADCVDEVDGALPVHATGRVLVGSPGAYKIIYTCSNKRGYPARPATREVFVRDRTCPLCTLAGKQDMKVEASFKYNEPGFRFSDVFDGVLRADDAFVTGTVDTKRVGTYRLTYRSHDAAGNWNDGGSKLGPPAAGSRAQCSGAKHCVRTVSVVDTLKPVISLAMGEKILHVSDASDLSKSDTAHANPASTRFVVNSNLMAEEQQQGSIFYLAAVGGMVVAAALLALSGRRKQEEELSALV